MQVFAHSAPDNGRIALCTGVAAVADEKRDKVAAGEEHETR